MLARRFSLVCILTALFGMGLASLVVEHHENRRTQNYSACSINQDFNCR